MYHVKSACVSLDFHYYIHHSLAPDLFSISSSKATEIYQVFLHILKSIQVQSMLFNVLNNIDLY